ncbi:MAG: ImmA/IrrE family metallo-endopeptidase [Candidatus Thiodiazotropha sp. (ex Lucina pensylvanica)]|nr:ImmA/IrrE family metallo-endopeptidase [Candidatus Thiodiazotropha sp. (ex Lucina pensylvanica)]
MDPFATREAERLLKELGVKSLPIDPLAIAAEHDIVCQGMPSKDGGVSGMFIKTQDAYGILYATHIDNEGFQNFSIGHELGHYFLPGHPEAVFSGGVIHGSRAGFVSDDKYENEADHFACGLLMPNYLFDPALDKAGDGLKAVQSLRELCRTSLTATAIRYAQRNPEPAAIVVSIGDTVDYSFMSDELKEYPGLTWIKKGSKIPRRALTCAFNKDSDNVRHANQDAGTIDLATWFGGDIEGELYEEIVGLGSYGKTLPDYP